MAKTTKTQLLTNAKAGNADPKEVDRLIRIGLELAENGAKATDDKNMRQYVNGGVTYSRAWQILTMTLLEASQPELIVPKEVRASKDKLGQAVVAMRDEQGNSWGLIGCRCMLPEDQVRKLYKLNSGKLDRGQRIGHGGRFLADDPTLYDAAQRHTNGVVIKSSAELDRAMGKIRDAAHAGDNTVFGQYVINSTLEPAPEKKARKPRTPKAKAEVQEGEVVAA